MAGGRLIACGKPAEVLTAACLKEVFGVAAEINHHEGLFSPIRYHPPDRVFSEESVMKHFAHAFAAAALFLPTGALAETFAVEMKNRDEKGSMVFEPDVATGWPTCDYWKVATAVPPGYCLRNSTAYCACRAAPVARGASSILNLGW